MATVISHQLSSPQGLALPVEPGEREVKPPLSGKRKAAIVLTILGDELTAAILRQFSEEEVHDLTRELSLITHVPEEERAAVLSDFLKMAKSSHAGALGGVEYATSVLMAAFGPETGKRMSERLMKSLGNEMPSLDTLRKTDPQQLAKVIHREHPQTQALIISHLGPSNAARVLSALPGDVRIQVVRRMALLDQVSPEMTNRLAKTICTKLRVLGDANLEAFGGMRTVAEILNQSGSAEADEVLEKLGSEDQSLAQNVRNLMLTFEDLVNISEPSMRQLQSAVDRKVLTLALKGTTPQLEKHFTSVMSQRAAEMLREDMDALGPVRVRDVMDAQQQVIATARRLEAEGAISLQSGAGEAFVM